MQIQATAAATSRPVAISAGLQIAAAFAVGIAILCGAAFLQTPAAHNATHDMRHSMGFPCH
jgi:cobalt transporter subunit CbtB